MKWLVLLRTVYLYLIAQLFAFFLAEQLLAYKNPLSQMVGTSIEPFYFLLIFFSATLLIIVLQRSKFAGYLFRTLFFLGSGAGLFTVFSTVFPLQVSIPVTFLFLIALAILPQIWVHDMVVVLASAGIGANLGLQFTWPYALGTLLFLSAYDLMAVYLTKHMQVMAGHMLKARAMFALIIPDSKTGFRASLTSVAPGAGFLVLGGGDIILPMLLSGSLVAISPPAAVFTGMGATLGVVANHFFLLYTRQPIPALPLITAGSALGFLIGSSI